MIITTTFTALRNADACKQGYRKLADHLGGVRKYGSNTPIPVSTILDSNGFDDTLWVLHNAASGDVKSVMVQWAIDCAERVAHLYTADDRPRKAIEAARAWLINPCDETRNAARAAARAAAYAADAAYAAARAADAAARAARAAYAADAAYAAARAADAAARAARAADRAVYDAADAADRAVYAAAYASYAVYAAERDWQIARLKELLG